VYLVSCGDVDVCLFQPAEICSRYQNECQPSWRFEREESLLPCSCSDYDLRRFQRICVGKDQYLHCTFFFCQPIHVQFIGDLHGHSNTECGHWNRHLQGWKHNAWDGYLSSGTATYSTSKLTAGSHSITASYGGNTNYNGSTSSVLTQTVNKANSTTALSSSLNPSTYGSSVKFTATITPSTATGSVTFLDGGTTIGTGTISNGKATFTTTTLTAGSHSITASYGGDANCNSSTSSVLTQTVNKANVSVALSSSMNPSAYGSSVTFTATITPSGATGTVTFMDGSSSLGSSPVNSGQATLSTSTLALGSHSITASYSGDSNYNAKTSSHLIQIVKQASSVALASSTNPSPFNGPVTFTASVAPSAATGTVTFMDGGTVLGSSTLSAGVCTFTTSVLALGFHSITAVYGGDTNYAGSTSSVLTQNVLTLSSIAVTPQSGSLPVGASQQFTAMGTFSDGSNGSISSSVTWTSSATNVATISTTGVGLGVDEGTTTIQAYLGTINNSASLTVTPSRFRFTGALGTAREFHTATLLQNGKVLVVGGYIGNGNFTGTAELYDPVTGNFSPTGNLSIPRAWHTATLLQNGMVLIVGGTSKGGPDNTNIPQPVAELYDPGTGAFGYAGSLNVGRSGHTATLLQNGTVLIAGGGSDNTAEIYDPAAGTFTYTGNLSSALTNHSATLLNDGTVLIAGGDNYLSMSVATAQIYAPTSGTFTATGSLVARRESHTATLLSSGKVLIAGGSDAQTGLVLSSAEQYDPVAKTFSVTGSLASGRSNDTATLLTNGQVLIPGGCCPNNDILSSAELYDPSSGTFSLAGNLNVGRAWHAAALLNDGTVLIVGGQDTASGQTSSAEIYESATPPPPYSLQITPAVASIVVGGTQQFTAVDNHGYPRQDVTWTVSDPSLATVAPGDDGAGVVTAIATGQVTLTANAEGATAQAQVTIVTQGSLVPGTTIWSAPLVPGFSQLQIAQAVPSASGPDLYSIQLSGDGTQSIIQGLMADGEQLWQTQLPPLNNSSVPDGVGGLLVTEYQTCTPGQTNPMTVVDLDPVTAQPLWQESAVPIYNGNQAVYCYPAGTAPWIAVRGDGAVVISEPTNVGFPPLTLVSASGYMTTYQIPQTTVTTHGNTIYVQCCMGPPMVNSDGTAYVEYEVRNVVDNVITSDTLYLFQINPDNSTSSAVLSTTTQNQALLPGSIIPDGQGGVLATWIISPSNPPVPQYPYQAADVMAGSVGTPYNLPFSPQTVKPGQFPTLVLGESGTVFASGPTTTSDGTNTPVSQIVSFSLSSGAPNWTYQTTTQNTTLSMIASSAGNTLVAKSTDQSGNDTVLRFDPSGVATSDTWTASQIGYFLAGSTWISSSSASAPTAFYAAPVVLSSSAWYEADGNGGNGAIQDVSLTNFSQSGTNQAAITSEFQKISGQLPSYTACSTWLQGAGQNQGTSGVQQIQGLLTNNLFGHATVNVGPPNRLLKNYS
jgi:hypothetical protein